MPSSSVPAAPAPNRCRSAKYRAKYGEDWDFAVDDEVFDPGGTSADVFRVTPTKVLAFAKSPHGQTRFQF